MKLTPSSAFIMAEGEISEVTAAVRYAVMEVLDRMSSEGILFREEHNAMKEAVLDKDIVFIEAVRQTVLTSEGKAKARLKASELFNFFGILTNYLVTTQDNASLRTVDVSGVLDKLPISSSNMRWKSRYFELRGAVISYYKKRGDQKPQGEVMLTKEMFVRDSDVPGKRKYTCFEMSTSRGMLRVAGTSASSKQVWVSAISRAIHSCRALSLVNKVKLTGGTPGEEDGVLGSSKALVDKKESVDFDVATAADEEKTGMLEKLAIKSQRNWKNRWFVLYRNLFSYYESESDKRPKGDLMLDPKSTVEFYSWTSKKGMERGNEGGFAATTTALANPGMFDAAPPASAHDDTASTKTFCLLITTSHKKLMVNCGTHDNRLDWMAKIRGAIALSKALAENSSALFGAKSFGDALLRRKKKQKRHRQSIIRTDEGITCEIIVTRNVKMDGPGEPVAKSLGTITAKQGDCLAVVRDLIYKQLDSDDIPLYFEFLQKLADAPNLGKQFWDELKTTHARRSVRLPKGGLNPEDIAAQGSAAPKTEGNDPETFSWLNRKLEGLYTKVTQIAEEKVRVGAYRHDGNRICILARESAVPGTGSNTPNMGEASLGVKRDPYGSSKNINADPAAESERCAQLQREVQRLQAQLAEVRRLLVSGSKTEDGVLQLSPLGTFLFNLQRDGYLDSEDTIEQLEEKYYDLFEVDDVTAILIQTGGPFENFVRRFCNQPARIRQFVDGLQHMFETCELNKARLTEPWWRKQLRDAKFMGFQEKKDFMDWAESEPWCEDTPERYAFLMGKMRGEKNKRTSMSTFILPIPTAEARAAIKSASSSEASRSPAPSLNARSEAPSAASITGRPAIAFGSELKTKFSSGSESSGPPNPGGFLGAIKGFNKSALKKSKK